METAIIFLIFAVYLLSWVLYIVYMFIRQSQKIKEIQKQQMILEIEVEQLKNQVENL